MVVESVLPLDAQVPTCEAVRAGELVVVDDMAAYRSDHPGLLAALSPLAGDKPKLRLVHGDPDALWRLKSD